MKRSYQVGKVGGSNIFHQRGGGNCGGGVVRGLNVSAAAPAEGHECFHGLGGDILIMRGNYLKFLRRPLHFLYA